MPSNLDRLVEELFPGDPVGQQMMRNVMRMEMSVGVSEFFTSGGRTHTKEQCKATRKQGAPKGCVLHKPTPHKLTGSKQILRRSTLIEDVCSHGIGHPNPDSARFLNWRDGYDPDKGSWFTHGCDGCCGPIKTKVSLPKYDYMEGEF
jgi:hypothetical protein